MAELEALQVLRSTHSYSTAVLPRCCGTDPRGPAGDVCFLFPWPLNHSVDLSCTGHSLFLHPLCCAGQQQRLRGGNQEGRSREGGKGGRAAAAGGTLGPCIRIVV